MIVPRMNLFALKSNLLRHPRRRSELYVAIAYWRADDLEQILTTVISSISPAALPLLVCVLGCCFIYLKIGKDRKQTKEERDSQKDELDKRLTLVEHDVCYMKQQHALFADKLDRILDVLCEIKVSLASKAERV